MNLKFAQYLQKGHVKIVKMRLIKKSHFDISTLYIVLPWRASLRTYCFQSYVNFLFLIQNLHLLKHLVKINIQREYLKLQGGPVLTLKIWYATLNLEKRCNMVTANHFPPACLVCCAHKKSDGLHHKSPRNLRIIRGQIMVWENLWKSNIWTQKLSFR